MDDHSIRVFEIQTKIGLLLELQIHIQKQINDLEEERQKYAQHLPRNTN